MIRTQIYLPDDKNKELRLLANVERKRFSDLIREGVDKVLADRKKKRRKKRFGEGFIGMIKEDLGKGGQELINEYYEKFGE